MSSNDSNAHQIENRELEAARLRAERAEAQLKQVTVRLDDTKIRQKLTEAATKAGFIKPNDDAILLRSRCKLSDTGRVVGLLDETPNELVNSLAEQAPYMLWSNNPTLQQTGGKSPSAPSPAYSPEQIFGKKSDSRLANQLALRDPKEYARLKAVAKDLRLI